MLTRIDREIIADLYLSRDGLALVEEIVERFGSRFGGTPQEHQAAEFIREGFAALDVDRVVLETFTCPGWTRNDTRLAVTAPIQREMDCIALPYCPPGTVEGPLVYLGDGDPQTFVVRRDEIRGAIAMATTAAPRFFPRGMHRCEKLGRALDAGATGFIWMRGMAGGLPETGSARFGHSCEVPAVSVSYETGHELIRLGKKGTVRLRLTSTNENHPVTSHNVIAEFRGRRKPDEIIVIGAHYDGHDISQSAMDNATGLAVLMEAARALAPHRDILDRTVRMIAFAQEEMGLHGAHHHAEQHKGEAIRFMLNLDGTARSMNASFDLQGWPEAVGFFKKLFDEIFEDDVAVGDQIGLYADMYAFAARGIPAATLKSEPVGSSAAASRGYGHTPLDSLDKVTAKYIQVDAARVARLAVRLATLDDVPMARKTPAEISAKLRERGLDEVLRLESRPVPGQG
ncbi:MAG: M28 family peptidase [Armatimonadetes bacterium]|nr:M28 family peptidase [Armatimonadota bacterium]